MEDGQRKAEAEDGGEKKLISSEKFNNVILRAIDNILIYFLYDKSFSFCDVSNERNGLFKENHFSLTWLLVVFVQCIVLSMRGDGNGHILGI